MNNTFICFDLKSFFASVECVEMGLDPMKINLLVADNSRTDKTICLAVTPALKSFGVKGRPRLFEAKHEVSKKNRERLKENNYKFTGKSYNVDELNNNKNLEIDFIITPPRMAYYIEYSTKIYNIYLKYFSSDDIHVYSIDEVFIDATPYMKYYNIDAVELASKIIEEVYNTTKITATCGIGTNLYLAKIAMDIKAKKMIINDNKPRIAYLDEQKFKEEMWDHLPLTDFWRIGNGITKRLNSIGIKTIGELARCSLGSRKQYHNEDLLFKTFGINAELLIDHAWGVETCTMKDIKTYKPVYNSLSNGQVLHYAYTYEETKIVLIEMIDSLILDLVIKDLVTDNVTLSIFYDNSNMTIDAIAREYTGEIVSDSYGRLMPRPVGGTVRLPLKCSSEEVIRAAVLDLYKSISNPKLLVRKLNLAVCQIEKKPNKILMPNIQMNLFQEIKTEDIKFDFNKENDLLKAIANIKGKYGKNSLIKTASLQEKATAKERNKQIGGHKA